MSTYFLYRNAWICDDAPHKEIQLSGAEATTLLKQGGMMVRNTCEFDIPKETCFWFIINDHYRSLEELSPRVRNKVRHANQYFDYRQVENAQFEQQVFPVFEDTIANYKIHDRKLNRKVFLEFLKQCKNKSFDYWGLFLKGTNEMAGYCMIKNWGDSCEIWNVGVLAKYKREGYYPYYGLYYHLNEYYLKEKGFRYISDGSRTITNHSEIHEWLIHYFGFRKAYCKLKLHYKWWFGFIVRTLYPFRNIIPNRSVKAVLKMHGMQTK